MYEFIKNNVESSDKIFLDAPNRNPLSFNELHQKLCNQLQELDYRGTVRYSGFVEPLIDKNISVVATRKKRLSYGHSK